MQTKLPKIISGNIILRFLRTSPRRNCVVLAATSSEEKLSSGLDQSYNLLRILFGHKLSKVLKLMQTKRLSEVGLER